MRIRTKKPTGVCLTFVEVMRWTSRPEAGLRRLLSYGQVDSDAIRALNSLADLVRILTERQPVAALSLENVNLLISQLSVEESVAEETILAVQQWLEIVAALLLKTRKIDYQAALNRLILAAEIKANFQGSD